MPKTVWAEVMSELTLEIDYGNFKNEVHKQPGLESYQDVLYEIWNTCYMGLKVN